MPNNKIEQILSEVKRRVLYNDKEYTQIENLARSLLTKVKGEVKMRGIDADIIIAGSLAKRTMIKGYGDIDIFIRLPNHFPKDGFYKFITELGNSLFGTRNYRMRYADHPYIEVDIKGYTFSIIPAYNVSIGNWKSPVDRTYYHLQYVQSHIKENPLLRENITLLKVFMRRVGIYGAEIYVKGFSGYLCELLILYYGSISKLFDNVLKWRPPIIIDIEGFYKNNKRDLLKLFEEPLIVIDPIDKARNVASAVSYQSLSRFISAVRSFMNSPSIEYFNIWSKPRYREINFPQGTNIIGIVFRHGEEIPDILYSQIEKVARKLVKQLELNGFTILKWEVFTNYVNKSLVLFALSNTELPMVKRRIGPSAHMKNEVDFILKNKNKFIWIDRDGRWKVLEKRDKVNVDEYIKKTLDTIALPKLLADKNYSIIYDDDLKSDRQLFDWYKEFKQRKEFWIDI